MTARGVIEDMREWGSALGRVHYEVSRLAMISDYHMGVDQIDRPTATGERLVSARPRSGHTCSYCGRWYWERPEQCKGCGAS